MNSEIISGKLLMISVSFSIIILFFTLIHSKSLKTTLTICNSENTITSVIHKFNFNIVIDSGSKLQSVECLGRILPFYERKIDVLITDDDNVIEEISKYYDIGEIKAVKEYKLSKTLLTITDKSIKVQNNRDIYYIYKRPINYLFKFPSEKSSEITLFRPLSNEVNELQINMLPYNQKVLSPSSILRITL